MEMQIFAVGIAAIGFAAVYAAVFGIDIRIRMIGKTRILTDEVDPAGDI